MAGEDESGERSLADAGAFGGGGISRKEARNVTRAAKVSARVNVQGVQSLISKYNEWLGVLQKVREQLNLINQAGQTGGSLLTGAPNLGGVGTGESSTNVAHFGAMNDKFKQTSTGIHVPKPMEIPKVDPLPGDEQQGQQQQQTQQGGGGGVFARFGGFARTMLGVSTGLGFLHEMGSNRFNRNLQESVGISQANMLTASMYSGFNYRQGELDVRGALGAMAGTRQESTGAFNTALRFGMGTQTAMSYMSNVVAPMVQASGGTMNAQEAAVSAGAFMDPMSMRRGMAMGIKPIMQAGVMQNPKQQAMQYIDSYEKKYSLTLNAIDFQNLRNPASRLRYVFKRIYQLSDESIDMIAEAGLQNVQYKTTVPGAGRDINFSSPEDLKAIGLTTGRLGLAAVNRASVMGTREAQFFKQQEGAQVGQLELANTIDKQLMAMEDALTPVIGALGRFEKVIDMAVAALSVAGMFGAMRGGGGFFGRGAAAAATAAAAGEAGAAPVAGGRGGLGAAGKGMLALAGVGVGMAGINMAKTEGAGAQAGGIAMGAGGFALAAGAVTGFNPIVMGAAAVVGGGLAVKNMADANYTRGSDRGEGVGITMTEKQLIDSFNDYKEGVKAQVAGSYAGAKQVGRFNVFQRRRGAMTAAMFQELIQAKVLSGDKLDANQVYDLTEMLAIVGNPEEIEDDDSWDKWHPRVVEWLEKATTINRGVTERIRRKFFGNVQDPFAIIPVNTAEAKGFVINTQDLLDAQLEPGQMQGQMDPNMTGDGEFDPAGGASGKNQSGPSWGQLDPRMRERLDKLFAASGGQVWLGAGGGWRSTETQRKVFLERHVEDPSGDILWEGKKWKRVRGAPAAPPGRSMHEIGLAADLAGPGVNNGWLEANAAQFGLKTFTHVNKEPWHVQLEELPNARSEYEKNGGTQGATSTTSGPKFLGDSGSVNFTGGSVGVSASNASGVNYGLAAQVGGSFSLVTARAAQASGLASAGGSSGGGGGSPLSGGSNLAVAAGAKLTAEQVAQVAYDAGFRGGDLINFVSIAMRESGGLTTAHNESYLTGAGNKKDMSYGLFQINQLPWLEKGMTPPWTKEQLYDPHFNAEVAYKMFKERGMQPWTIKGDWSKGTNHDAAELAVKTAGLGDGSFDRGGGGVGTVSYGPISLTFGNIQLNSTGKLEYDAKQFAGAAAARTREAIEIEQKRRGGS